MRECLFFFNATATTHIYTLSLHDALPISHQEVRELVGARTGRAPSHLRRAVPSRRRCDRSEEHTSELQSHHDLVCRLLLEKKNGPGRPATSSASPVARPWRMCMETPPQPE